jgi:hypothetical protein
MVRAEDQSGNFSQVSTYAIEVVPPDYEDFAISTNIRDSRLEEDILDLKITTNVQEKFATGMRNTISLRRSDPFLHGTMVEMDSTQNSSQYNLSLKNMSPGLYVLSLGLEYSDGTKSYPRHYLFEYKMVREKKKRQQTVRLSNNLAVLTDYMFRSFGPEKLRPEIHLTGEDGIFKVDFSLPKDFDRIIEGFSYKVSGLPSLPDGEVNYVSSPVYLYDLSPGIYYLSVRPVFSLSEPNEKSAYSYVRFEIARTHFWSSPLFYIPALLALSILLLLLSMQRIRYQLGRFAS